MRSKLIYFLFATVLVLLTALAVWKFNQRPSNDLFRPTYAGSTFEPEADPWHDGIHAYREGRFEEAALMLDAFPDVAEAIYFRALSLMELERESEVEALWEFVRYNEPTYYADATWYLSLTYFKLGKIEEGYTLMQELYRSPDPVYSAKADAFLSAYIETVTSE